MKKIILFAFVLSIICASLSGCIHWEEQVTFEMMQDPSKIARICVYSTEDGSILAYKYEDPDDPCRVFVGEIPPEQFARFAEELTALPFKEDHLIILFPVTYDPNFYYGEYLVKVEYTDGRCELISEPLSRQFGTNGKAKLIRHSTDRELWLTFLQNWVDIEDK